MIDGVILFGLATAVGTFIALVMSKRPPGNRAARAPDGSDGASQGEDRASTRWWTNTWEGSFFELYIHLGAPDDARLLAAIQALWNGDALDGPIASPDGVPPPLLTVSPRRTGDVRFYGRLRLPSSPPIDCCLITHCGDGADDLMLYVPWAMLETHFGPEPATAAGIQEVLAAFLNVADELFEKVPFKLGAIGEEVLTDFAINDRPEVQGYDFDAQFAEYLDVAPKLGTMGSESTESLGASGGVLFSPDLKDRAVLPGFTITVLPSGLLWFSQRAGNATQGPGHRTERPA